jgi:hypothetical protein
MRAKETAARVRTGWLRAVGLALLGTGLLTVCFLRLEGVFGVAGLTALAASRLAGSE